MPSRLVALSHRALAPRSPDAGFASPVTRRLVTAAAVGLAFIGACTLPQDSSPQPTNDPISTDPALAGSSTQAAALAQPEIVISNDWPGSLDELGLRTYAAWAEMFGPWKSTTLAGLLAWEHGAPAPSLALPSRSDNVNANAIADFETELSRYLARGFGQTTLIDLHALLAAAERASLFDAAFAGHLWRAAEQVVAPDPGDVLALEQRARLYGRLAHHHHVVQALISTAATLGPITQRAWLKKSAPPPNWRSLEIPEGFELAARQQLGANVQGPWDSVGLSVVFDADGAHVVGYRQGVASEQRSQRAVRWGRLDVMLFGDDTRVVIGDGWVIEVAAGSVLTFASLAAAMPASLVAQLDELIGRALAGDQDAVAELELLLPIAHARLRAQLDEAPEAVGGPALRTILVGYEE